MGDFTIDFTDAYDFAKRWGEECREIDATIEQLKIFQTMLLKNMLGIKTRDFFDLWTMYKKIENIISTLKKRR